MSHYYVLSRFLISRMLTVTKIPYMKVSQGDTVTSVLSDRHADTPARVQAVKIALEVKKYLIDNDQFDVSQVKRKKLVFHAMHQTVLSCEAFPCRKTLRPYCSTSWRAKALAQNIPSAIRWSIGSIKRDGP